MGAACSHRRAAEAPTDQSEEPYFAAGFPNEVSPEATAIACNLTVTGGTSGSTRGSVHVIVDISGHFI
jgi:hypothetical protein